MKTILIVLALSFVGGNCNPPSPPPDAAPPPPAPGDCAAACAALRTAGCSLGDAGDCPTFLSGLIATGKQANPVTSRPITCTDIATVKTKADAVTLGFSCQ